MDGNKPIPLHSVNVKMTRAMNSALNVLSANRSEAVRLIVDGALEDSDIGRAAMKEVMAAAERTSATSLSSLGNPKIRWNKRMAWITQDTHMEIEKLLEGTGLRPADFLRGCVLAFADLDPVADAIKDGHNVWAAQIETDDKKAG